MNCDCLNSCGDDPWLKDGRSQPCQDLINFRVREQQAIERAEKIEEIGKVYGNNNVLDLVVLLHERIVCLTTENERLRTALNNPSRTGGTGSVATPFGTKGDTS